LIKNDQKISPQNYTYIPTCPFELHIKT